MRIFMALLTVYAVGHVYLFLCLRRAFGGGKWQIPVALWLLAMAGSWFFRFSRQFGPWGERFQDLASIWMGLFILLSYCLIATDLTALFVRILAFITKADGLRAVAQWITPPRYVPVALAVGVALFGYSLFEAHNPRITRIALTSDKLAPGSAPLTIAAAADVHLSSLIGPWILQRQAKLIAAEQPDILIFSGDVVDINMDERSQDADILRAIPTTYGKIAVTGNHENYRGVDMAVRFLEKAGVRVLRGQWVEIGGIVLAGVDDDTFKGRYVPDTTNVHQLLSTVPQDKFILLMRHQPRVSPDDVGLFDLQFSGHTHSGQFWPGMLVTQRIYGFDQGLTPLDIQGRHSLLYLTNGMGYWGPPIRFLAPPEIVIFTLSPAVS